MKKYFGFSLFLFFLILGPWARTLNAADIISSDLPTLFGAAVATSTLNGGTIPEINFWFGPNWFSTTLPLSKVSPNLTVGIEITTKRIPLFDKFDLSWNLGWERTAGSGSDSFGPSATPAYWNFPINGLYLGPRLEQDFGAFSLYGYVYGSFDDLSDLVTNDSIIIGATSYSLSGNTFSWEPGCGLSIKVNDNFSFGADYSHQFLQFYNIGITAPPGTSFPAAYSPTHSLDLSGDSITFDMTFSSPPDIKKQNDQTADDDRKKLADAKYPFTKDEFKKHAAECDTVVTSWYLAAKMKIKKEDLPKSTCPEVLELIKKRDDSTATQTPTTTPVPTKNPI